MLLIVAANIKMKKLNEQDMNNGEHLMVYCIMMYVCSEQYTYLQPLLFNVPLTPRNNGSLQYPRG